MRDSPEETPERKEFYDRIGAHHLTPLWQVIRRLLAREPTTQAQPHLWPYTVVRPFLLESGGLISAEEAERRVLILQNPGFAESGSITETLYAGLQLILPGEVAPAHRHTPAAIRFIVEGSGAYTSVNGERAYMEPGDFIITPSWTWHDHAHEGKEPMVWLDVLDVPLVRFLGPCFTEDYSASQFPETRPPGDSESRYGANLKPVDDNFDRPHSPLLRYPYAQTREALTRLARGGGWDDYCGIKLEYINPLTGEPALPTISTFLQLLPKGFESKRVRATDASVYSVVEGRGQTIVGDGAEAISLSWTPGDHFVVPCWCPHRHVADEESVLFSASDRVVQQKLGLWREERSDPDR